MKVKVFEAISHVGLERQINDYFLEEGIDHDHKLEIKFSANEFVNNGNTSQLFAALIYYSK